MLWVFRNCGVFLFLCARTVVCPGAKVYAHNLSQPGDRGPTSDPGGTQHELRRTGRVSLRLGLPAYSAPWGGVWGGWTVVWTRAFLRRWGSCSYLFTSHISDKCLCVYVTYQPQVTVSCRQFDVLWDLSFSRRWLKGSCHVWCSSFQSARRLVHRLHSVRLGA